MGGFQPTIGKWYDYENYDIDKPQWKRLLNIAEKHRDTSEVRNVMSWLANRGIRDDWCLDYLACYGVIGKAFCLDDEVKKVLIPSVMEDINHFPEGIYSLKDYTVIVLRGTNVPELIIEEFKLAYEKIAKMR